MDKISSLLEESSESTFDPFSENDDFDGLQAGAIPPVRKSSGSVRKSSGLGESTSVSRSSGFYSIQKPKRREHTTVRAKTDPRLIQKSLKKEPRKRKISGTYSIGKDDQRPIKREKVSSKSMEAIFRQKAVESHVDQSEHSLAEEMKSSPKVSGSYQYVKSDLNTVRREEVSLASNVEAPRPVGRLKQTFDKILGRKIDPQIGSSGEQWLEDKPEGDKYWTVAADDSQRDDHSIWTLLLVFTLLTILFAILLWLLLG